MACAIVVGLVLYALRQNINLFYYPSDLYLLKSMPRHPIRIGGVVREDSLQNIDGLKIKFVITDFSHEVDVSYTGILPDLFKEGQGVVAGGKLNDQNIFIADQILAKHDENYRARDINAS